MADDKERYQQQLEFERQEPDGQLTIMVYDVINGAITRTPELRLIASTGASPSVLIAGINRTARWICSAARNSGAATDASGTSTAQLLLNKWERVEYGQANLSGRERTELRSLFWEGLDDIVQCLDFDDGMGVVKGGAVLARPDLA